MNRLRLMELVLTLEQGGVQRLILDKLTYLRDEGVFVCVGAFHDGAVRAMLEARDIPVLLIPPKRYPALVLPLFLREMRRIGRHLRDALNQHEISILQTHILNVYDFLTPGLRDTVPSLHSLIWTFHNTEFEIRRYDRFSLKMPVYRWLYRRLAANVDAIVAVSDGVRDSIQHDFAFPDDRIHVIPNAIPVNDFRRERNRAVVDIPPEAPMLLTVGRLTEQKGQRYALDALKIMLEQRPDVFLCLAGDGEDRHQLESHAEALGILSNVRFLGVRDDIPDLLAACDVFVMPSLWEGLSEALLEAMATGKPIVATDISGANQVVSDGVNACLVPPRNAAALAKGITNLLQNPDRARKYGERALALAREQYDIARLGRDYLELYHRLLMHHA